MGKVARIVHHAGIKDLQFRSKGPNAADDIGIYFSRRRGGSFRVTRMEMDKGDSELNGLMDLFGDLLRLQGGMGCRCAGRHHPGGGKIEYIVWMGEDGSGHLKLSLDGQLNPQKRIEKKRIRLAT